MTFNVRQMNAADVKVWAGMRAALWPGDPLEIHAEDIGRMLGGRKTWGFIAETLTGAAAGFAELAIRDYANGCETRPVGFLEGIWVAPEFRRQGAGATLIAHIEGFLIARGFREIGSDAFINDSLSHEAHAGWGFSETERVVYFRKTLGPKGG